MTFISWAQNYEDVMLRRALAGVEHGFWIDVGAWDPDQDSVTRAFADMGWHGINVEPEPTKAAQLRYHRPEDITVEAAVGAAPGRMTLHRIGDTGLSTLDDAIAAGHAVRGVNVTEDVEVDVTTLAAICEAHAPAAIHFLKIDVEGAERAVLEGADFRRFRPWIVLIEATAPNSTVPTHGQWEDLMLAADYRFVWFDGLNRFYVAAERHAALAESFAAPPNYFDDFRRVTDATVEANLLWSTSERAKAQVDAIAASVRMTEAARAEAAAAADQARAAEARAQSAAATAAAAEARAQSAEAAAAAAEMRAQATEARARTAEAQVEAMAAEADAMAARIATAQREAAAHIGSLTAAIAAMRASTSWRITAPLRRLRRLF